jgi:4'-phosphopantetheinyl transferase
MHQIFWLEADRSKVPDHDSWLGPGERDVLRGFRIPKRREDWRLGRWTAKRALAGTPWLSELTSRAGAAAGRTNRSGVYDAGQFASLSRVEIRAAEDGAPEAALDGVELPVSLSLSHSEGRALAAVAAEELAIGCDIELVESRSSEFVHDYFTPAERAAIDAAGPDRRALAATLMWSAKESALKALRVGLRFDTRSVEVRPCRGAEDRGWLALEASA